MPSVAFHLLTLGPMVEQMMLVYYQTLRLDRPFEENPTNLNLPRPTPHGNKTLPYVLLGDDISPSKPGLCSPTLVRILMNHKECITQYRLSRARRTTESTFSILSGKWRTFPEAHNGKCRFGLENHPSHCVSFTITCSWEKMQITVEQV